MDEEETAIKYWEAIHTLEEVLKSGHRSKQEMIDDLELMDW